MENLLKHITLKNTTQLLLKLVKKLLYWLVVAIEMIVLLLDKFFQYLKRLAAPKMALMHQLLEKRAVEFLEH
jgi:hypothetical protein